MGLEHTGERILPEHYHSSAEDHLIFLFHQATYAFARRYMEGREVLDYGCGGGHGSSQIARVAKRVVGVDVSSEAVEYARTTHRSGNVSFETIDGGRPLPFGDGTFDAVLSSQVIEHVRDADRYLGEARRVLRQGGHLVLATPDRRTRLLPLQRPWNRWHVTEYAPRRLGRALTRHFSEVEILCMSGEPDVIDLELKRARKAMWLMLPLTLPLLPDALRLAALDRVQRLRHRRSGSGPSAGGDSAAGYGFDESALRIAPGVWPSVNLVAVARR